LQPIITPYARRLKVHEYKENERLAEVSAAKQTISHNQSILKMFLKLAAILLAASGFAASQIIVDPLLLEGNATVFIPSGLSACGRSRIPSNALVAGVSKAFFESNQPHGDSNPHHNSLCGRSITVENGGKIVSAEIVEECADCKGQFDLILSPNAFKAITGTNHGVVQVEWFLTPKSK